MKKNNKSKIKTTYYMGEMDSKINEIKQKEREKYVNWLLEETPHPKSQGHYLTQRFLALSVESLELYKKTGEMKLFSGIKCWVEGKEILL